MQDANHLPWTEQHARADTVALGLKGGTWTAPVLPGQALGADLGPKSIAVHARANHGRWIVECPDCSGAQLACPDDHRFMCNECANAVVGGFYRPVIWPRDKAKIEALLMARSDPSTRNWFPHESVTDLRAENKTFGVSA